MGRYDQKEVKFSDLKGKTLTAIEGGVGDSTLRLECDDGSVYQMHYYEDCCASCSVDEIHGDLKDLIGSPILQADEESSIENPPGVPVPEYQDSFTWTFYKLATIKGSVTIRWYGSSNGFYSESVTFEKIA